SLFIIFCLSFFFFYSSADPRDLHSFPTRRSSDLWRFSATSHKSCGNAATSRNFGAWTIERSNRPWIHIGSSLDSPAKSCSQCGRSEEHTSELQSPCNLVCRLLLEKKKNKQLKQNN